MGGKTTWSQAAMDNRAQMRGGSARSAAASAAEEPSKEVS
jgi:hypothetical protein